MWGFFWSTLGRRLDRIRREMSEDSVSRMPEAELSLPSTPPPWTMEPPPSYDTVMKSQEPGEQPWTLLDVFHVSWCFLRLWQTVDAPEVAKIRLSACPNVAFTSWLSDEPTRSAQSRLPPSPRRPFSEQSLQICDLLFAFLRPTTVAAGRARSSRPRSPLCMCTFLWSKQLGCCCSALPKITLMSFALSLVRY